MTEQQLIDDYTAWCEKTGVPFKQYRLDLLLKRFGY